MGTIAEWIPLFYPANPLPEPQFLPVPIFGPNAKSARESLSSNPTTDSATSHATTGKKGLKGVVRKLSHAWKHAIGKESQEDGSENEAGDRVSTMTLRSEKKHSKRKALLKALKAVDNFVSMFAYPLPPPHLPRV